MPRTDTFDLACMQEAVLTGDDERAADLARRALEAGLEPMLLLEEGFIPGIRRAGALWESGDYFLPELVAAAQAMRVATDLLRPHLERNPGHRVPRTVLLGTVQGDIHDIGKTLVGALLTAHGFVVVDEGVDVPVERFVDRARELDADLIGASALLTTTMGMQERLVAAVRESGIRAKVMVGGAPVTRDWARKIGADSYADSAVAAVAAAREILEERGRLCDQGS